MRPERVLDRLDPEQADAVSAAPGPLLVVAGAGTGKTTTLVSRIAYQCAAQAWNPHRVLAVTHSTKAAGQMRDRLLRFGVPDTQAVTARTFHAAALRILRHFWAQTGRPGDLQIADSMYPGVRAALRRLERTDPDGTTVFDVSSEIGWAKALMLTPATYPAAAARAGRVVNGRTFAQVAKVYEAYQKELLAAGKVDFTDLLTLTAELVETNEQVAVAVRGRYHHLLVDEYQDTDPAQQRLLMAWLGGRDDITAVGDPRQSVYGFKGGDISLIETFVDRHPGTRVVRLVRDYRSTPQIVQPANTLMRTPSGEALIGMRPDGPPVTVTECADEASEAQYVASKVAEAIAAGVSPAEIAVLYRFNAQSAPFEQALTARGIAYTVSDTERFFERPEIVEVLTRAQRAVMEHEADTGRPAGEDDDEDDDEDDGPRLLGADLLRQVAASIGFDRANPPQGTGRARDRWEAVAALLDLVESLPSAELLAARDLLTELGRRRDEAHGTTSRTVTLATLHKAKGLEWDVVFLPRMVEGSLPSAYATTDALVAEERRLTYVGLTRGRARTLCSFPRMRGNGKKTWPATESRFLAEAGLRAPATPARPTSTRTGRTATGSVRSSAGFGSCGTCRRPLETAAEAKLGQCEQHLPAGDAALLTALLDWRRQAAAGKPVYTVLTDATLLALVANRPTTPAALVQIPGIGARKAGDYGSDVIALIAAA